MTWNRTFKSSTLKEKTPFGNHHHFFLVQFWGWRVVVITLSPIAIASWQPVENDSLRWWEMRQDLYGTDPTFIHFHFHWTMMGAKATGNSNLDSLLISSVSYLDSLFWERLSFGLIVFSNRGLHRDTLRHALFPLNVLNTPFGFLENQRIYFTLQSSSFICILYTKRYRQNSSDTPWIWFAWDCLLFCHGINHHLVGTFLEGFQTFYRQIQDIGMFRFGQNPTDQLFWFKKICFWRVHPSQHCRVLLQSQTPLTPRAQGFFFPPWSRGG